MVSGKRGRQPKGPSNVLQVSIPPSPPPYKVSLVKSAEEYYLQLKKLHDEADAKGDTTNQHCTTFRMVDDAIRKLIPSDPKNRKYALHKPLDGFYRIAKGRMRIAWAVHPSAREVMVIFISTEPRRDGDVSDPYAILNSMAKAGALDKIMSEWMALKPPPGARAH